MMAHLLNEAVNDVDPNSSAAALRHCMTSQLMMWRRVTNESDLDQPHPGTDAALLPLIQGKQITC
jgi:hypothetical protein